MQSYEELVKLARLCAQQSRLSSLKEASVELWRMAEEYQEMAARLNGSKLPEIGKPPFLVRMDTKKGSTSSES
jgi:hypothetical protein